jgi:RND family efflux transporter MFP subunit
MEVRTNLLRELEREFLHPAGKQPRWIKRFLFLFLGVALGLSLLSLYVYLKGGPTAARFFGLGIPVETVVVRGVELTEIIGASGKTAPAFTTEIKSDIPGKILFLPVTAGTVVPKGHVLAQLDPAPYKATLQSAQEKFTKAKVGFEKSELFEKRMNELFSRRLLASAELEKATRQLETARLTFSDAAEELLTAQDNLDNVVITAKTPGMIMEQKVTLGQMVHARDTLFVLGNTESVRVVVSVPQEKATHIITGQETDIILDSYPDMTLAGEVEKIETEEEQLLESGFLDQKMNVSIRVKSESKMKIGLPAYAWIKSHRRGLTIPRFSLIQGTDGRFYLDRKRQESVFVVQNSRARVQPIRIGMMRKNMVEVVEGLQEGQEVVSRGLSNLKDNDRVKLKVPPK